MTTSTSFVKIAECLYRNPATGIIYALVKLKGKQHKCSLKTKVLTEARRKLGDYRRDLEKIDPGAGKVTVGDLADRYLATVLHQAPETVGQKKAIVARIREKWRTVPAKNLQKSQVLGWLASFSFGPSSRNKYLRVVRAMFQLGVDDRLLVSSPVAGVKESKLARPIRLTPTLAEFQSIVASIRNQPWSDTREESADFVEFLGLAGLGLAEAAGLTWGDVRFESEQIITFRQKTRQGFAVPIYPQLRPLLERRHRHAKMFHGDVLAPNAKVFTVANAKKAVETACERLGLPKYTSRSFRRMFITTAIERGVDVKVIALWQGHRDGGKLILDTYSHVRPIHSQNMAKLMTLKQPANVVPITALG